MIFVYKTWEKFCKKLSENKIHSIRICDCFNQQQIGFLSLKHDVETNVERAFRLAQIENKYGHKGTYYVQAYLMDDSANIEMLKKMQKMGHEISYHYDVMDSNKGNIDNAIVEFEKNIKKFEDNGFAIHTLCQHGNPVVERIGYHSNRDFFRSEKVQKKYPNMCDVMVDLKIKSGKEYDYYSDAGRKFKFIFDPINNDIVNSDDKNVSYKDLEALFEAITRSPNNCIISTHPHRWTASKVVYIFKSAVFKIIKSVAKLLIKIPFMKKFMSKYYYLAKKI